MQLLIRYIAFAAIIITCTASANEWRVFSYDLRRSNVTTEGVGADLTLRWQQNFDPPLMAWEGPAKWDAYSGKTDLKSMRNFDPAYFVTVADGRVYYGSSVDDGAHALDAETGEHIWSYFTEGPVRFPPTYHEGRVYFGSDDGHAYCLNAESGAFIWKYKALPDDRYIPINGKLVSLAPVRTSVLVDNGTAYFAASLLPWRPSYLCAVDALTGEDVGEGHFRIKHEGVTFQGAILLSQENIYALQGRMPPMVYARDDGKRRGTISGTGGAFALLTEEDTFVSGAPSQKVDVIEEKTAGRRADQLASYPNANRMVVRSGIAYLQSEEELSAFDRASFLDLQGQIIALDKDREKQEDQLKELRKKRKEAGIGDPSDEERAIVDTIRTLKEQTGEITDKLPSCFQWRVACHEPHALVLAGDILFAGGDKTVVAYDAKSGDTLASYAVDGAAHGIAVANDTLFISTDAGSIYAFGKK